MIGIPCGQASAVVTPLLQWFCRSGGFLADPAAATYRIEYLNPATSAVTEVVPTTALTDAEKLSTGRYALLTGDTSAWTIGSYRAIVSFTLTAGGQSFTEVVPFELLTAADWPVGDLFVSYISAYQALSDGYVASTATVQQIHKYSSLVSRRIEGWTRRVFHPQRRVLYLNGNGRNILHLEDAIIAIGDIADTWITSSGQDSYTYSHDSYLVMNRHLSGLTHPDDRRNPAIVTNGQVYTPLRSFYAWPQGDRNIQVTGVFGYTDPPIRQGDADTGLGSTPMDLVQAAGALLARTLADPSFSDPSTYRPGSIRSFRTGKQSISFGGSQGTGLEPTAWSGDPTVDGILMRYAKPISMGWV